MLNTDADTLEGFAVALQDAGFQPLTLNTRGTTHVDVGTFLTSANPDVVVYDIGPPYTEAIRHWGEVRKTSIVQGRPFVLTTTGRGLELGCFGDCETEVLEKPFSFDRLVRAVRRAVRRCAARNAR